MRILFISATYPPSVNGVAVTVENLKRLLEAKGHDVTVLAPDNSNKPVNEKGIIRYPSLDNPVVPDYPIPLFPGVKAIRKLIKSERFMSPRFSSIFLATSASMISILLSGMEYSLL